MSNATNKASNHKPSGRNMSVGEVQSKIKAIESNQQLPSGSKKK